MLAYWTENYYELNFNFIIKLCDVWTHLNTLFRPIAQYLRQMANVIDRDVQTPETSPQTRK